MGSRGIEVAAVSATARAPTWPPRRLTCLLAMAGIALCLGLLVYVAERSTTHTMLLPRFAAQGGGPHFAAITQWLPSFIHPFAFSLLSAAALRHRVTGGQPPYTVCALWWAVNLAFELGQHPRFSTPLADALQAGWGHTRWPRRSRSTSCTVASPGPTSQP
jgi:hypothetical protein